MPISTSVSVKRFGTYRRTPLEGSKWSEAKFIGKNSAAYRKLAQKEANVILQMEDLELVTLADMDAKLNEQKTIKKDLQKENDSLLEQHNTKVKGMNEAQVAERVAMQTAKRQFRELYWGTWPRNFENKGGKLSEVGERQQRIKVTELKSSVEKALWFAKTFGLDLESAIFKDEHSANNNSTYSEKVRKSYKYLAEADQQKVRNVLFNLDKFCIGNQAYHELSMLPQNEELPRSNLIKQLKYDINNLCNITRTPELAEGAQLDILKKVEPVIQN